MSLQQTPTPPAREIRAAGPDGDAEALRRAYLDLLKLCLCDLTGAATQTVSWTGDRRVFYRELPDEQLEWRISGRDWPLNALTMTGLRRLDDLQACVESVVESGISGDLVEAGAWRGGSSILMRAALDALGERERTVWVADSFSGFPAPEPGGVDEDRELEAEMGPLAYLAPSLEQVRGYFERFGLCSGVRFVPGFFEHTMAQLRGHRWSVVRLDADTYKATRLTLEALYPGLSVGGYVISDDYAFLPACRRAVDDFRAEHGITEPIEQIDHNAVRWRRESPADGSWPDEVQRAEQPPPPRDAVAPTVERVPSARELELSDELAGLRAQLAAVQAEIEALRDAPWTGAKEWLSRRLGRR
jgi:O-methyltransferase